MTPGAATIRPVRLLKCALQTGAIEHPLTQEHPLGPKRDQVVNLLHQCDLKVFWKMALFVLALQLAKRQRPPFIHPMDHQGDPAASPDAAIDH